MTETETLTAPQGKKNAFVRAVEKLYGGINMTWPKVIIFAVAAAAVTAAFLIIPIFDNTSFYNLGVFYEGWVLFAVIIMVNCKKPLESALKTFVFFLISQPLIYLFQVPFSEMGWALFGYYRFWFFFTLLTFPMAFAGWFLKKGNWISLLILTPMNVFLLITGTGFLRDHLILDFPSHLISVIVCYGQVVLYMLVFFRRWFYRLVGFAVPLVICLVLVLVSPAVDTGLNTDLPDAPVLSDQAYAVLEDESFGTADISVTDGSGYVSLRLQKYGEVKLKVIDGDKEYDYIVEVSRSDGHSRVNLRTADNQDDRSVAP